MTELTISSIKEAIQNARITCGQPPEANDVSCADPDFEANWFRVHREVGDSWCSWNPGPAAEKAIDELREAVVSLVRSQTDDATLASYVGGDFDFIIRAAWLRFDDNWIEALWSLYARGGNPYDAR
jgi:hypothetical protein